MNINQKLKTASQVLFTDDDYFNKDLTGLKSLKEIKERMKIYGKPRLVGVFSNCYVYQLNGYYNFTITILS